MNVQSVALDVTKQPQISPVLYLGQGDKNGTTLEAAIYDDGTALALTGKSARFCMRTPNGAGYYECDGTVSGNTATFLIDETYAATVDGITDVAYVEILEGSTVICSTNRFRVVVLRNATEDADPNGAYTNGVQRFLDDAADQLEEFEESTVGAIDEARQQVDEAVEEADAATARAIAAAEAAEGIVLQDIPTMSPTVKGGATLGNGLRVDDGALSLGDLVQSGSGAEVVTDGCAIYSVEGEGWSEQRTTTGKNLLPSATPGTTTSNGVTFNVKQDGTVECSGTASGTAVLNIVFSGAPFQSAGDSYVLSGCPSGGGTDQGHSLILTDSGGRGVVFDTGSAKAFSGSSTIAKAQIVVRNGTNADGLVFEPMVEVGDTKTSYEPYTGGVPSPSPDYPQEIEVARGRNLFESVLANTSLSHSGSSSVVSSNANCYCYVAEVLANTTYTISSTSGNRMVVCESDTATPSAGTSLTDLVYDSANPKTKTFTTGTKKYVVAYLSNAGVVSDAQLELGSTPTPYVPYGHIGLEVTHDGTTTVTPIPLPTKGFAASLPDGTADALTVDSAGRWEWVNNADEAVFDGTENWSYNANSNFAFTAKPTDGGDFGSGSSSAGKFLLDRFLVAGSSAAGTAYASGANILFWCGGAYSPTSSAEAKAWAAANPITLLYPLATPTTEHGYIDLPSISDGCSVSIPELEQIGCSWFVDGCEPIVEHAANMARRETEENESIEDALAELAARVAALES